MKKHIEKNFTAILMLGIVAGLYMPGLNHLPNYSAIVLVGLVMFFSCSKITLSELQHLNKGAALLFYVLRFLLFPALLYIGAKQLFPHYAAGILLIALMPTGVAGAAFANLTGGNPSIALLSTAFTNALTPFIVPLMMLWLTGNHMEIDSLSMFTTLMASIMFPAACYFLLARKIAPVKAFVKLNAQATSTVLLGAMAACVIALQREFIFAHTQEVLYALLIACLLYALLYFTGWIYAFREDMRHKKTYALCSGCNNIALSAGLAALYLPSAIVVFTVMGEIAWIFGVAVFKKLMEHPYFCSDPVPTA